MNARVRRFAYLPQKIKRMIRRHLTWCNFVFGKETIRQFSNCSVVLLMSLSPIISNRRSVWMSTNKTVQTSGCRAIKNASRLLRQAPVVKKFARQFMMACRVIIWRPGAVRYPRPSPCDRRWRDFVIKAGLADFVDAPIYGIDQERWILVRKSEDPGIGGERFAGQTHCRSCISSGNRHSVDLASASALAVLLIRPSSAARLASRNAALRRAVLAVERRKYVGRVRPRPEKPRDVGTDPARRIGPHVARGVRAHEAGALMRIVNVLLL